MGVCFEVGERWAGGPVGYTHQFRCHGLWSLVVACYIVGDLCFIASGVSNNYRARLVQCLLVLVQVGCSGWLGSTPLSGLLPVIIL